MNHFERYCFSIVELWVKREEIPRDTPFAELERLAGREEEPPAPEPQTDLFAPLGAGR